MAIPISYNVRNVLQRPVSTLTTAVGVGLTVAIFIGALALAGGFQAALIESGSKDNALALRKGADTEIWGDNAVLMPALQRDDVFQSVTFRMRDPAAFDALKRRIESDPRLGLQLRSEREFYASQSQLLSNVIRFMGVFITIIMAVGAI